MIGRALRQLLAVAVSILLAGVNTPAALGQALPKPDVGPEKPFAPPPRVERTLGNGLRVVAVRYATVPKVSAILTVKAGLAVDPAGRPGSPSWWPRPRRKAPRPDPASS